MSGFLGLFGPGGPLSLMNQYTPGAGPMGGTGLTLAGGQMGPGASGSPGPIATANPPGSDTFDPSILNLVGAGGDIGAQNGGGDIGAQIAMAGAMAPPSFFDALRAQGQPAVQQSAPLVSPQSISSLIDSLLGPAPTLDQLFSTQPYNDAIAKLTSNKVGAAKGISDAYTKALADLASASASAKQDQAQFAATTNQNANAATQAQQAFLQSIGANGAPGSALGALLQGQAARMATDQSNQANTTARLASIQNNDLGHAQQDAALGQMGSLNQLNSQTAGAQAKISQQEAADRTTALKELASLMSARQSQSSSLLNNATSFIDKNTTSINSRDQVQQQLAQMQQSGDTVTPHTFGSIVYGGDPDGKGGYTVGAKNEAEAIQRIQNAMAPRPNKDPTLNWPGLVQAGVDPQGLIQMVHDYYTNTTTKRQPADMMDTLRQYLQAISGG